jgi:hypothetical protein
MGGVPVDPGVEPRRAVASPNGPATSDAPPPPEVALLAATALGYAFTSGLTATNVATLVTLAEHEQGTLLAAQGAVTGVAVATAAERRTAVDLLARAARRAGPIATPSVARGVA